MSVSKPMTLSFMSVSKPMTLYKNLEDKPKRLVNKLIRLSHKNIIDESQYSKINTLLNRAKKPQKKRKANGYVIFYKDNFDRHRAKMNEIGGVTGVAKLIGKQWQALSQKERDQYTKTAQKLRLST